MRGDDYRAKTRLSDAAGATLADVGERCSRIPASSLPWLLQQGLIEPTDGDRAGQGDEED